MTYCLERLTHENVHSDENAASAVSSGRLLVTLSLLVALISSFELLGTGSMPGEPVLIETDHLAGVVLRYKVGGSEKLGAFTYPYNSRNRDF
jgi:hypothetical protein